MPNVTQYNAKDTTVIVDGVHITGLGEDMISYEKEEAVSELIVGAQGDIIRSEINNDIYTLTLSVQPTSPQLRHLMSLKNRQETFPVWVMNKKLGLTLGGSKACINEMPEISLGAEAEDIEITFSVLDGDIKVG